MLVYIPAYFASMLFARISLYGISGIVLISAALWLYMQDYRRFKSLLNLRGLFSLSFAGGQGIACLKLSRLAADWSLTTWLCLFLAHTVFWLVYEFLCIYHLAPDNVRRNGMNFNADATFKVIVGLTSVSAAAFISEAFILGYIPLFIRGVPHAYSEFHISGLHYFTVSSVLIPALSVLYFHYEREQSGARAAAVCISAVTGLLIPVLCVSRFQFIFALMLAATTYTLLKKTAGILTAVALIALLIPVYIILSIARSHDVAYLNSIFEMKNELPIFISQPYTYIANNYENFNYMVENLPRHSFGMRQLFPLWALSGLKFIFPALTDFPVYVNKTELTTVTLFYDAYYDFGAAGILLLSAVLGACAYLMESVIRDARNPVCYIFYAQLAMYMSLAFFTTWFSNPTTWFYLVLTGFIYLLCGRRR